MPTLLPYIGGWYLFADGPSLSPQRCLFRLYAVRCPQCALFRGKITNIRILLYIVGTTFYTCNTVFPPPPSLVGPAHSRPPFFALHRLFAFSDHSFRVFARPPPFAASVQRNCASSVALHSVATVHRAACGHRTVGTNTRAESCWRALLVQAGLPPPFSHPSNVCLKDIRLSRHTFRHSLCAKFSGLRLQR